MTRDEFKVILAGIETVYGDVVETQEQFDIWYDNLQDLEYKTVQLAVKKIIQESEFAPRIATIRKQCLEVSGQVLKSKADCLLLMNKAISKFGRYRTVEAMEWLKEQDETTYHVAKAVGLVTYCNSDPNFSNGLILKMYDEVAKNKQKSLLISREFAKEIREMKGNGLMITENY